MYLVTTGTYDRTVGPNRSVNGEFEEYADALVLATEIIADHNRHCTSRKLWASAANEWSCSSGQFVRIEKVRK